MDQTDNFADAFVCENVAHGNDVVSLCLEKFSVRKRKF